MVGWEVYGIVMVSSILAHVSDARHGPRRLTKRNCFSRLSNILWRLIIEASTTSGGARMVMGAFDVVRILGRGIWSRSCLIMNVRCTQARGRLGSACAGGGQKLM